jgi:hypothetical protein
MPILCPSIGPGSASSCTNAGETVTFSAGLPFGADRPKPAAAATLIVPQQDVSGNEIGPSPDAG